MLSLRTIQWKNKVSILINDWVTANYSVSQPPFCPPSWNLFRICVKLLQLISGALRPIQWKNKVSILINGWVTANYSVSQPPFCSASWNLLSDMCQTSTTDVWCHYAQLSEKNEVSILIYGWVTVKYSVSRPSFCPVSWNLYSDLYQTSTTDVRCHYAQFSEKIKYLY